MQSKFITTSNRFAVMGDIHGMYNQFILIYQWLEKYYPDILENHLLFHLGDLVDRGPDSKKVVGFIRQKSIQGVKGNHDDVFIGIHDKSIMKMHLTKMMGGFATFASYMPSKVPSDIKEYIQYKDKIENRVLQIPSDEIEEYEKVSLQHRMYCAHLSDYIVINQLDKLYLLSHAGFNISNINVLKYNYLHATNVSLTTEDLLWTHKRTLPQTEYHQITGHLPDDKVRHDGYNWWIDTGSCFPRGKLSCLIMPEKIIIETDGIYIREL